MKIASVLPVSGLDHVCASRGRPRTSYAFIFRSRTPDDDPRCDATRHACMRRDFGFPRSARIVQPVSQADADRCDDTLREKVRRGRADELCSHSHLTRCDTARGSRETGGPCANANSPESLSLSLSLAAPLEPTNRPTNRPTDRPTDRSNRTESSWRNRYLQHHSPFPLHRRSYRPPPLLFSYDLSCIPI